MLEPMRDRRCRALTRLTTRHRRRHLGDLGQAVASASASLPLAFRSLISSFMAAFSSAVNTLDAALRAGYFVTGVASSSCIAPDSPDLRGAVVPTPAIQTNGQWMKDAMSSPRPGEPSDVNQGRSGAGASAP